MQTTTALAKLVAAEARGEMAKQKLKIADLAQHLGCSYRTANVLLNGKQPINFDQLVLLGQFLGVPPLELANRAQPAA